MNKLKKVLIFFSLFSFILFNSYNQTNAAYILEWVTSFYSSLMKLMFDSQQATPSWNYAKYFYEWHNFLKELYRDNTPPDFTIRLNQSDFADWFSNLTIKWVKVPFIENSSLYISARAQWSGSPWKEVFMDDIDPSVYWRKITTPVSEFMTNSEIDAIPLFTKAQTNWTTLTPWQKIYAFILLPSWNLIIPDTAYPLYYRKSVQKWYYQLNKTCISPWDSINILSYCIKNPTQYYFSKNDDATASIQGSTISTTSLAKGTYYIKWAWGLCTENSELSFEVRPEWCNTSYIPMTSYSTSWTSWGWIYSWWWGWGGWWGGWWSYVPPTQSGEIWFPKISLRIKLWAFEDTSFVSDESWVVWKYEAYLLQDKYKTRNWYSKLFTCYMKKNSVDTIHCGSIDFQHPPVSIVEKAFSWTVTDLMGVKMAETVGGDAYFTLNGKRYFIDQDQTSIDFIITETTESNLSTNLGISLTEGLLNWFDRKIKDLPLWLYINKIIATAKYDLYNGMLTKLSIFENSNNIIFDDSDEFYTIDWTPYQISCKKSNSWVNSICAILNPENNVVVKREATSSYYQPVIIPINDWNNVTKVFLYDPFDDLSNIIVN